jgi:DNA-directed RNA polymerase subunit beta
VSDPEPLITANRFPSSSNSGGPNLIEVQLNSFRWFQEKGLKQLFEEISPIKDFTGNRLELSFVGYEFREPRYNEQESRQKDLTYSAPLYVRTRLLVKETGEIKEQDLFFGDIPLMTAKGTFITSGAERVVSQLLRSPGVYLALRKPYQRASSVLWKGYPLGEPGWSLKTSNRGIICCKSDGKRKIPEALFYGYGYGTDDQLLVCLPGSIPIPTINISPPWTEIWASRTRLRL